MISIIGGVVMIGAATAYAAAMAKFISKNDNS